MVNFLTQHMPCVITTTDGESIVGVFGGVETGHGHWSVLVHQAARTLIIPIEVIHEAAPSVIV